MRGAERRAGQERTRSGLVLKLVYGLTLQRDGRSRVSGLSENDVVKSMPELVSALSICDKVIADRPRTRAWPRPRCARLLGSSPKVAHADEGERASIPVPDHGGHGNRPALGRGGRRVRKLVSSAPLIPSSLFKDARGGAAQPRAGRLQQSGAELLPLKPAAASKIYVRFALSRDRLLSLLHLDFEFLLDTATSPRPTCITRDLLSSCRTCARAVTTPRSTKAGTSDLRRTSSRRFSEPRRALRAYPYATRESPDPGRLRRLSQRLNKRVLTSHSS